VTCHSGPDGTPLSSACQPTIVVVMLKPARPPKPGDHVLEIGARSRYNAALLAHLVAPGGQVTSMEIGQDPVGLGQLGDLGQHLGFPVGRRAAEGLVCPAGAARARTIQLPPFADGQPELEETNRGLLDPAAAGLALVLEQARQLIGFSDPASLTALRTHLAASRPLDLRSLEIQAVPSGSPR
jgi:hypothetical protein